MNKLFILAALAFSVVSQGPKEVSAESVIANVREFLKDNDVQGKFSLMSCTRLSYRGEPTGMVWHVRMVKNGTAAYSLGLNAYGKLLWFEPDGGGSRRGPVSTEEWKKRATERANQLFAKLKSEYKVAQPNDDLVTFRSDWVYLPIVVNGKRFVGTNLGYTYGFEPDMQLRSFARNDTVPKVSAENPAIEPSAALEEAKQSLEEDVKGQNMKGHRFTFGKETLVYYYQGSMNEARLCWYFKVQAEYDYAFSTKGGEFGVVVDALTGKRIKTPTMLS